MVKKDLRWFHLGTFLVNLIIFAIYVFVVGRIIHKTLSKPIEQLRYEIECGGGKLTVNVEKLGDNASYSTQGNVEM
jgi:hypothetical protein